MGRVLTFAFLIATLVAFLGLAPDAIGTSWGVRWRPVHILYERSACVLRVAVVGYGPTSGYATEPNGTSVLGDAQEPKYPVYRSVSVRVLGALKGHCDRDTLSLRHEPWDYPSDIIVDAQYTLGHEYILFLPTCDHNGPIGTWLQRFEYDEGMVRGPITSKELSTMSVAQFRELLKGD